MSTQAPSVPTVVRDVARQCLDEVLSAAARHAAVVDQLDAIRARAESGALSPEDRERLLRLREQRRDLRKRHDHALERYRRLAIRLRAG